MIHPVNEPLATGAVVYTGVSLGLALIAGCGVLAYCIVDILRRMERRHAPGDFQEEAAASLAEDSWVAAGLDTQQSGLALCEEGVVRKPVSYMLTLASLSTFGLVLVLMACMADIAETRVHDDGQEDGPRTQGIGNIMEM